MKVSRALLVASGMLAVATPTMASRLVPRDLDQGSLADLVAYDCAGPPCRSSGA